jgi:hypothetical protein
MVPAGASLGNGATEALSLNVPTLWMRLSGLLSPKDAVSTHVPIQSTSTIQWSCVGVSPLFSQEAQNFELIIFVFAGL